MNSNQTALNKIRSLSESAQKNNETKNYYYEDVLLYTHFLELWSKEDNRDAFSEDDQSRIENYLNVLNNKFISEYQAALNNFDDDLNLQSADLLHLTPKDNKANLKEYVTIQQYFNNQLTPNAVIDDINNIDEPIKKLIEHKELPEYANKLSWMELYLLINAIAYQHWFNK